MITKAPSFITSDNQSFLTLDAAKGHELGLLLNIEVIAIIDAIVQNADKVIDILSTTATSKVRARRVNGGTKKRKAKLDAAAVNHQLQDGDQ